MANLMQSVMGAFAEFDVRLSANVNGRALLWPNSAAFSKGGKKTLTPERAAELIRRAGSGVPKAVLARDYGISRGTVYQYLRQAKLK